MCDRTEKELLISLLKKLNLEIVYESEKELEFYPHSFGSISINFDAEGHITGIYVL